MLGSWSSATNIHKQYGVYFVCHPPRIQTQDLSNHDQNITIDVLDRSAMKAGYKPYLNEIKLAQWICFKLPKTKRPFRATLKRSFYVSYSPPSAHPSDHKKLYLTLLLSDVRRGANPIQMFIILLIRGAQGTIRGALKEAPSRGRRAEDGGRTTKGKGGRRTADRRKFLLLFSNTLRLCVFRFFVCCQNFTQTLFLHYINFG